MSYTKLVASIIKCLKQLLEEDDLTSGSRESLEVAIQCLESAYNTQIADSIAQFDILQSFKSMEYGLKQNGESTPGAKAEADRLKSEGNTLTKNEKYHEALVKYTKAIELDNKNAVFYCNRAAVYSKIGNDQQAIKDCYSALSIDPSYSKAYGRLGLAYSNLNKYKEAKENYQKALELEPDNESLKTNLNIADEKLKEQYSSSENNENASSNTPVMDLSSLLSNPALMNMARQMLSDPTMQNMMSTLMSGNVEHGGRMDALIEAGQQLAQQMQTANPELIESLRRQMGRNMNTPDDTEKKEL